MTRYVTKYAGSSLTFQMVEAPGGLMRYHVVLEVRYGMRFFGFLSIYAPVQHIRPVDAVNGMVAIAVALERLPHPGWVLSSMECIVDSAAARERGRRKLAVLVAESRRSSSCVKDSATSTSWKRSACERVDPPGRDDRRGGR